MRRGGGVLACLLLFSFLEEGARAWYDGQLDGTLRSFGTLHRDDITHRIIPNRRSPKPRAHVRRMAVQIADRQFVLSLSPHERLFSPDFKVISHDGSSKVKHHSLNIYQFYEGHVHGEKKSHAWVHVDDDNIVTATITLGNVSYHIEPSWRHFKGPHLFHMITYKSSDIISNLTSCGIDLSTSQDESFMHVEDDDDDELMLTRSDTLRRRKRAIGEDSCEIALVADHLFFAHVGGNNVGAMAQYLINVAGAVDNRFRVTDWGDGFSNLGLMIRKVIIHERPSSLNDDVAPYNVPTSTPGRVWNQNTYLEEIGYSKEGWDDFCLVHVFTYQDFPGGLLGLAPIASSRANKAGGICSFVLRGTQSRVRHTNVGFSTGINHGRTLIVKEAEVVVQHEIGHNWGSPHDPNQCSGGNDGRYIMSATAVDGSDGNNFVFSSCSRASILSVLKTKSHCFTGRSETFCGNGYREDGEECDGGGQIGESNDDCCTNSCTLRSSAACSDRSDACCQDCRYARANTLCFQAPELDELCHDDTYCSGDSKSCPERNFKADGRSCLGNGQCKNQSCLHFCELMEKQSCICNKPEDECKVCCLSTNCTAADPTVFHLDGTPCSLGLCESGNCVKKTQDVISRLWNFIEQLSIDTIGEWVRDNIVAAVLFFSLVVWVPTCIVIWCFDHRRKRAKLGKEAEYQDRQNQDQTDSARDDSLASLIGNEETSRFDDRLWYSLDEDPKQRRKIKLQLAS